MHCYGSRNNIYTFVQFNVGDASVTASKPKLSINLSGSVQAEHHRSFELPKNTILGFACYEMTFDSALGTFELVLPDSIDGDELHVNKHCIFDEPDGQNGKWNV